MQILSISTSSNICSAAILEDNNILKQININNAKTHSENLMPIIKQVLDETNLFLSDIDYLACDIGPGSFTGIRIGIASIKALAEISNVPICAVSSLEGLASLVNINSGLIVSLIDARNDQAYCGIFHNDYSKESNFIADSIDNIIKILKDKRWKFNVCRQCKHFTSSKIETSLPYFCFF